MIDNTAKLRAICNDAVKQILKPRPRLTGSEWANQHFYLSAETATNQGRYRWETAAFQKEWLDVMTDTETRTVVLMTSARVGKSTAMKAATGFFMASDPASMMWMLPTLEIARTFSVTELDPMLRDVAVLRQLVRAKRERDSGNNILTKRYKGGVWFGVGAESPSGLHGKTVRVLFADEADRFPESAGKDGDPLQLASIRTTTFGDRAKRVVSSTPTYKDLSAIEQMYNEGDRRRFYVPCPDCSHMQVLKWAHLIFTDNPLEPEYVCQGCGSAISERYKPAMIRRGMWIAENPTATTKSYHINALYSPYTSWADLVREWVNAKGNQERLKVFINSRLGETWDTAQDRVTSNQLALRLETYNAAMPTKSETCNGAAILSAGVDVQTNRVELLVMAAGAKDEYWLVDSHVIEGDTAGDQIWRDLEGWLLSARYKTTNGATVGLRCIAIDRGFATVAVDTFVSRLKRIDTQNRTILAVRGQELLPRLINQHVKTSKTNTLYYNVGTNIGKERVAALLKNDPNNQAACIHLPEFLPEIDGEVRALDMEVLEQLTSERAVRKVVKGRYVTEWKKTRERNEALDCCVYALAAIAHIGGTLTTAMPGLVDKVAALRGETTPDNHPGTAQTIPPIPPVMRKPAFKVHTSKTRNRDVWRK